jgi:hypothetical protein
MTDFLEMDRAEAEALLRADHAGDEAARDFWRSLFDPDARCFLCDRPADHKVSLIPAPDDATKVLVTARCAECFAIPMMYRAAKERRMLREIWPAASWNFNRPAPKRRKRR